MRVQKYSFQFHKGTIRTNRPNNNTAAQRVFQFHKGTIRTFIDCGNVIEDGNFNSIKVRLEQFTQKGIQVPTIFQFHKGTIRTIDTQRNKVSNIINFNSIKVRLERISMKKAN